MMKRLFDALAHRRAPLVAVALAVVLWLPALRVGELFDDHLHRAALGPVAMADARSRWGLFGFLDPDQARTERLLERGVVPWWTSPRARVVFNRPLAGLTHRLDHALFPDHVWLMHAHSLAWAALLCFAVSALYRRILGAGSAAGLATLIYAVDDARGFSVGWIANRNTLMAGCFSALALIAYDRAVRERWKPGQWLAPVCVLAALGSAEAGVGAVALLLAHALTLDPSPKLLPRALTLSPSLGVTGAWVVGSSLAGYGAVGTGLYLDPARDPALFLRAAIMRVPVLLAGQWGPVPAELESFLPPSKTPLAVLAAALFLGLLAVALRPLIRASREARFFAVAMLLAVVPCCATLPSDRLLTCTGIGASGLIALAILSLLDRGATRVRRATGLFLAFVHLVWAALLLPIRTYSPALLGRLFDPCMRLPEGGANVSRAVLVNALDMCVAYMPLREGIAGRPSPPHLHLLTAGVAPVSLTRRGPRALLVRRDDGWFSIPSERAFVDATTPWHVGWERRLSGLRIEVRALTTDGRPREVLFEFDTSLDDPSLGWFEIERGALVRFTPPRDGGDTVTLPRAY